MKKSKSIELGPMNLASPNGTFNKHNCHETKLLTRFPVGLSHLREYKFRHNFQDSLDPFYNCCQ